MKRRIARSCLRQVKQARFTCVTRSWCTPLSHIVADSLASWHNRHYTRLIGFDSPTTATSAQLSWRSRLEQHEPMWLELDWRLSLGHR
jgi:hypothetical protein